MIRMHRQLVTAAALGLALASPAPVRAQKPLLHPGQLIRVTAPAAGMWREPATLVAVTPDSVVLLRTMYVPRGAVAQPDTVRTSVARGSVDRLEIRSRIAALTMPAALVGGALGAAAGANAGRRSGYSRCGLWFVFCFELSPGDKATIYGIVGGGLGMGVGAVLGSLVGTEHWRTIAPDELPAAVAPDSVVRTVVRFTGAARPLPWLEPGQRVRVTAPTAGLTRAVVSLAAWTADSLVVVRTGPVSGMPDSARIPLRLVTALDASAGRRGHTVLGIVIGGLAGGAAGAVYGYSQGDNTPAQNFICDYIFPCEARTAAGKAVANGLAGAFYGGIAGGLVGTFVKTERWLPVPLDRVRLAVVAPDPGRLGMVVALSF